MTGQDNTAKLQGKTRDELVDEQFNATVSKMARLLVDSMESLKSLSKDDDALCAIKDEDSVFFTRNGWGLYAYRDTGNDEDTVVCGIDFGLSMFFNDVSHCFADSGLEIDQNLVAQGLIKIDGDEECTDWFIQKLEDKIEELVGVSVSIQQDWEYSPATVKIECYVTAPFKRDCAGITDEEFDKILGDIVAEEGRALLTVPGVYEVLSEHFNNEILERFGEHGLSSPRESNETCTRLVSRRGDN